MGKYKQKIKNEIKKSVSMVLNPAYKMLYWLTAPHIRPKKYKVSICAIFRDEGDYLREWLIYHRIIGIDHFYLYNNFSKDDYSEILEPYLQKNIVTLIEWPVPQGQMAAYKDCVERFGKETNWIGFIDLDEYIVPNQENDIKDFLKKFYRRPLVLIYWMYFTSSGHLSKPDQTTPMVENFTVCWNDYADIGKLFFNTAYDYADELRVNQYMHYRWGRRGRIPLPPVNVFDEVCVWDIAFGSKKSMPIQINHYVVKSYEEFQAKQKRGDAVYSNYIKDDTYFFDHDMLGCKKDYHIFKYLIKLKMQLRDFSNL